MATTYAELWDVVARKYSEQPIADVKNYERKLASTQALMRPDMNVLELGCGTGMTALEHAPHVAHIDAVDASAAMIGIGREKTEEAGVRNISFNQASVEDFSAPESSYDMVLALNLIHLLRDRQAALGKIHGLLKPDGLFIQSTACFEDQMSVMRINFLLMEAHGQAPFTHFLRARQVLAETLASGFDELQHWTHGSSNTLFLIARKSG